MDGKSNIAQSFGFALTKDGEDVSVPELKEMYNQDQTVKKVVFDNVLVIYRGLR